MASFERHIFVCIHERPEGDPRGCCSEKGSVDIAKQMKMSAYERGLKRVVRVNKAGCLDQCARGVSCVVYPENIWYGAVTEADVEEIVESHLEGGVPVERLIVPHDQLTGKKPERSE